MALIALIDFIAIFINSFFDSQLLKKILRVDEIKKELRKNPRSFRSLCKKIMRSVFWHTASLWHHHYSLLFKFKITDQSDKNLMVIFFGAENCTSDQRHLFHIWTIYREWFPTEFDHPPVVRSKCSILWNRWNVENWFRSFVRHLLK